MESSYSDSFAKMIEQRIEGIDRRISTLESMINMQSRTVDTLLQATISNNNTGKTNAAPVTPHVESHTVSPAEEPIEPTAPPLPPPPSPSLPPVSIPPPPPSPSIYDDKKYDGGTTTTNNSVYNMHEEDNMLYLLRRAAI